MLELASDAASVCISPELGASILSYELTNGQQVLRPAPEPRDAFETACYLLAPWCNRIDGGITLPDGTYQPIDQTHPDHPLPIHGSAALQSWDIVERSAAGATLAVTCTEPSPFHYHASVHYALDGASLRISLSVTHLGEAPLPYGLGLHPWFVRTPKTRLQAKASTWQRTDSRQIPVSDEPVSAEGQNDFNASRNLPDTLIDSAFGGWDGIAHLQITPDLKISISTEPALRHYQVYSTGKDADFVCFEPVSHPINAHNMAGHPGLALLSQGETKTITVTLTPKP